MSTPFLDASAPTPQHDGCRQGSDQHLGHRGHGDAVTRRGQGLATAYVLAHGRTLAVCPQGRHDARVGSDRPRPGSGESHKIMPFLVRPPRTAPPKGGRLYRSLPHPRPCLAKAYGDGGEHVDSYRPGPSAWRWGVGVWAVFLIGALVFVVRDGWTGTRILGVLLAAAWLVYCLAGLRRSHRTHQQEERGESR